MKCSIGFSALLAVGSAAIYVDAALKQVYHARDVQEDSHFHVRDANGLLTTIVQRSPKGGSPKGAGGGESGGSKQPSSPSRSPSKSPSTSPGRGRTSDRGSGSPRGRSKSPENPFAIAADSGLPDRKGAAFPALSDRLRSGGTLKPQPRRRPILFDSGAAGPSQGRPTFSGAGQGALFSGSRLTGHGGGGAKGKAGSGASRDEAGSQMEASGRGWQQSTMLSPSAGASQGSTGQESSSNQDSTKQRRSLEDDDTYTYFTRSFDALPGSFWTRDTIDSNNLLQPRGSPTKPSNGGSNINNNNPTSARRRESTGRGNSPPVRGNSPPQAEIPRLLRSATSLARASNQNLQALMSNPANPIAQHSPSASPQTPPTTLQGGWRSDFLRSAMRPVSGSVGSMGSRRHQQHVTFADPVATPIRPSQFELPRSSSTESLGEAG